LVDGNLVEATDSASQILPHLQFAVGSVSFNYPLLAYLSELIVVLPKNRRPLTQKRLATILNALFILIEDAN
jgi:hypothetical protein